MLLGRLAESKKSKQKLKRSASIIDNSDDDLQEAPKKISSFSSDTIEEIKEDIVDIASMFWDIQLSFRFVWHIIDTPHA